MRNCRVRASTVSTRSHGQLSCRPVVTLAPLVSTPAHRRRLTAEVDWALQSCSDAAPFLERELRSGRASLGYGRARAAAGRVRHFGSRSAHPDARDRRGDGDEFPLAGGARLRRTWHRCRPARGRTSQRQIGGSPSRLPFRYPGLSGRLPARRVRSSSFLTAAAFMSSMNPRSARVFPRGSRRRSRPEACG